LATVLSLQYKHKDINIDGVNSMMFCFVIYSPLSVQDWLLLLCLSFMFLYV